MPKTISFHNGTVWSRGHNTRDKRYIKKQEHIDTFLTANNVIICDVPVRQAYEEIFGQAVQEYNSRQKRADRRIDCYYDKIKQDKRKHPVYECIVQIGDKDDTGNTAELEKQALIRFAEEWGERNPNLHLIGAYIHADEPNGTVHLHCDYIPVAECSRGMVLQNSYDRALQQQGFKSENVHQTAQIAWQDSEREALCAICRELNIDVQRNQGIGKGREYLTPQEYKRAKDKMAEQIGTELQPLKDELEEYRMLKISEKAPELDEKRVLFQQRVSVPIDELETLKKQAKAYRTNRKEIKALRDKKIKLDEQQQQLNERSKSLDEQKEQLERDKQTLESDYQNVMEMYNKQRNINELLERAEDDISVLTDKNLSLSRTVNNQTETIQELQKQNTELKQALRNAYESLTCVTKAIGMLKYSNDDYRASLTEQQGRLIDAIAKYSEYWTEYDGFNDLAEDIRKHIGISKGIQSEINELMPKKNRGRGGMSL